MISERLSLYKSSLSFNSSRATYKEFVLGVRELTFVVFDGLLFKVPDPLYFGGCNFLISNPFSTIVSVSDSPRGEVQVLFGHQKQQSPTLGSGLP